MGSADTGEEPRMATRTIRARYENGVLTPLQALDIAEGSEVTIELDTASEVPYEERLRRFRSSAGGWKDLLDCEKLLKETYDSRKIQTRPVVKL